MNATDIPGSTLPISQNEPHTADLVTRSRYRREGAQFERERIVAMLEEKDKGRTHSTGTQCHICQFIIWLGEQDET